jgi:hypothetical protein
MKILIVLVILEAAMTAAFFLVGPGGPPPVAPVPEVGEPEPASPEGIPNEDSDGAEPADEIDIQTGLSGRVVDRDPRRRPGPLPGVGVPPGRRSYPGGDRGGHSWRLGQRGNPAL